MTQNKVSISAEHTALVNKVAEHLQFLGYETFPDESDPAEFFAKQTNKANLFVRVIPKGIRFNTIYGLQESAKTQRLNCLEYVNSLNVEGIASQFCLSGNDSLYIQSWMLAPYERVTFGQFIQIWDDDLACLFKHPDTPKILD